MLLGQDKTRISIDGDINLRQFSPDFSTWTETTGEASPYADNKFLELEECDGFLLAPRREDSDYVFELGGLLNWYPDEESLSEDYEFDYPYEIVQNGTVWIHIWDVTEIEKPAAMEKVEAGSLWLFEDFGILSLIEDVVKDACDAVMEELSKR